MKNILIALGWGIWASVGGVWLRLGQPFDAWPDILATVLLGAAHGFAVGFLVAKWQMWAQRRPPLRGE